MFVYGRGGVVLCGQVFVGRKGRGERLDSSLVYCERHPPIQ